MNEFVDLIQKYILHEMSTEDFFTQYSVLRNRVLDEYNTHPLREMELTIQKNFLAGIVSKEEFDRQSEIIREEVQSYFSRLGSLVPSTPEYELLIGDLVFLIDRLDGDEDVYGEDVLSEETFYEEVKHLLNKLVRPKK
jgi:hypothetical protein